MGCVARSCEPSGGETTPQRGSSNDLTIHLLGVIGRRRGWDLDELGDASGMTVPQLQHALLLLELGGRIQRSSGWVTRAS